MALNRTPQDLHPQLQAPKATKTGSRRQPNRFLEEAVHSQFGQPSPIDFLTSLGRLRRGFQANDGTQAPHGGFHLSHYFFSLVSG